ncbi:hypothetical protein NDU88_005850, partial [Pleurodeles waltl]
VPKATQARRPSLHPSWLTRMARVRLQSHHHLSTSLSKLLGHSVNIKKSKLPGSRPPSSKPISLSAPHLNEFPGARAIPAQLTEFYGAMRLIFGPSSPVGVPLSPAGLAGAPWGSTPAASATAPRDTKGSTSGFK